MLVFLAVWMVGLWVAIWSWLRLSEFLARRRWLALAGELGLEPTTGRRRRSLDGEIEGHPVRVLWSRRNTGEWDEDLGADVGTTWRSGTAITVRFEPSVEPGQVTTSAREALERLRETLPDVEVSEASVSLYLSGREPTNERLSSIVRALVQLAQRWQS